MTGSFWSICLKNLKHTLNLLVALKALTMRPNSHSFSDGNNQRLPFSCLTAQRAVTRSWCKSATDAYCLPQSSKQLCSSGSHHTSLSAHLGAVWGMGQPIPMGSSAAEQTHVLPSNLEITYSCHRAGIPLGICTCLQAIFLSFVLYAHQ